MKRSCPTTKDKYARYIRLLPLEPAQCEITQSSIFGLFFHLYGDGGTREVDDAEAFGPVEFWLGGFGVGPGDVLGVDFTAGAVEVEAPDVAILRWQMGSIRGETGEGDGDLRGPLVVQVFVVVERAVYGDFDGDAFGVPLGAAVVARRAVQDGAQGVELEIEVDRYIAGVGGCKVNFAGSTKV